MLKMGKSSLETILFNIKDPIHEGTQVIYYKKMSEDINLTYI